MLSISGSMIPKVETCVHVVHDGVEKEHIINGSKHHGHTAGAAHHGKGHYDQRS
jgi:acetylglutamate kinase